MNSPDQPIAAYACRPKIRMVLAWVLSLALTLALFHASPAEADIAATSQVEFSNLVIDCAPGSEHMPGHAVHCHCLLHISAQATDGIIAMMGLDQGYVERAEQMPPSATSGLPYKPPRA